ncbi:MAG: hypothetical protein IT374_19155 [Polyangiaceae bacterium]|nr:hypothetical protein [Polyangiaceae bacterium]
MVLGAKRLIYRTPFPGARSLDAATGDDYRVLTSKGTGVLDVYVFQRLAPERFLFEAVAPSATTPSGTTPVILVGDGLDTPAPWLAPEDRGEDATVRFAGTHVAWLRGYGQKNLNVYEKVETWTADLDPVGNPVQPRVVEATPGAAQNATRGALSHGRFAAIHTADRARVCELDTAHCYDLVFPPEFGPFYHLVGLTDTHLWIETSIGKRMFRLRLGEASP